MDNYQVQGRMGQDEPFAFNDELPEENTITVKGCGCYYTDKEYLNLCDKHKDEFILKLYNEKNNNSIN
ncbi:MAG: hypothetical protein ACPKPY_05065 [Nitrososphaeraceae archaeon]